MRLQFLNYLYRACKKRLTAYERDARLQQMKNSQREHLGVKTTANRYQIAADEHLCQQGRLAAESTARPERDTRLEQAFSMKG